MKETKFKLCIVGILIKSISFTCLITECEALKNLERCGILADFLTRECHPVKLRANLFSSAVSHQICYIILKLMSTSVRQIPVSQI